MIGVFKQSISPPAAVTLPGCKLWCESLKLNSNGSWPDDGASLSSIIDLSASADSPAQSTGAAQPTFVYSQPSVNFNGSSQYLTVPLNIDYTVMPTVTLFFLYRSNSGGNASQALYGQDNGGFDRFVLLANPTYGPSISNGSIAQSVPEFGNRDVWQLAIIQLQNLVASGSQIWINGTSVLTFTDSHTNSGTSTFNIAEIGSGLYYSKIDLKVVGVFNRTLTTAERTAIHTDIYNRFGLAGV